MFPYWNIGRLQQKNSKIKNTFVNVFFTFYSKLQAGCIVEHVPTHAFIRNLYFYLKLAFFFWFARSENLFHPSLHRLYVFFTLSSPAGSKAVLKS